MMKINPRLKEQIEQDILACKNHTQIKDSENLYNTLVSRYSVLDREFEKGLTYNLKAVVVGSEFDYRPALSAIVAKLETYLLLAEQDEYNEFRKSPKSINELLSEDILRCEQYINNPVDIELGREIYIEITGRYDGIINDFGNGLYMYSERGHFYNPELSDHSLLHNLKVLCQRMIAYRANNYSIEENKKQKPNNSRKAEYDVFISHANNDKTPYVERLKKSLDKLDISIFYDKDSLEWGDNWKNRILDGVNKAEFAIIVISENFFGREWTEKELNEFLNRQNANGQKLILPILYKITFEQLKEKYPSIADIQCIESSKLKFDEVALLFARQLIKRLKA